LPSVAGLVGEHHAADGIADGEDPRIGRALLPVHPDEALGVQLHARVLEPQLLGGGFSSDGHQHTLEALLGRNPCAFQAHRHPGCILPQAFHPGVQPDVGKDRIQTLLQGIDQIRVHTRQEAVLQLHETHRLPRAGVHRAQLEPDIPAAQNEQRGRLYPRARAPRWSS